MMKRREQNALFTLLTTQSWPRRISALVILVGAVTAFYTQHTSSDVEVICGRIIGIADGDTATLLTPNNTSVRIRFAFIDAPEKQQAYGQAAKKNLSDLIYDHSVEVHVKAIDQYGRTVGHVFSDGKDINLAQVAMGYAWHYKTYAKRMQSQALFASYAQAQANAKQSRLGLWQEAKPVPPWEFRRREKKARSKAKA
jgi:endonuclease YncB( thermonuclease family)